MAGPCLPNIEPLIAMGINPKTGLPYKLDGVAGSLLKDNIKRVLRINDEQVCINRFKWYNLPDDLDGQLLERVLYYRGQGAFFYMESLNRFFFLPYALDGEIDVYGRYTGITPLPFNGSMGSNEKELKPWIKGLIKKPIYSVYTTEEGLTLDEFNNNCVLLSDYSKQISQTTLPRQTLNEGIIDVEADCIPFLRTALLNSTGVMGMRVNNQDEYSSVSQASISVNNAALAGHKYIPIIGSVDFQDLTGGETAKSEEFLQTMQSLDNFRLGTIGLENGGLFQKKAHMLQDEQSMNAGAGIGPIMQDGLTLRQTFCDIVNSIWGLGIWCEVSETVDELDRDMNGALEDEQDMYGAEEGAQPMEVFDNEDDSY